MTRSIAQSLHGAVGIGDLLILLSDFANFCEDLD
jgi:hypothetical protein